MVKNLYQSRLRAAKDIDKLLFKIRDNLVKNLFMAECRVSKRARKNNREYWKRNQSYPPLSSNENEELLNKIKLWKAKR